MASSWLPNWCIDWNRPDAGKHPYKYLPEENDDAIKNGYCGCKRQLHMYTHTVLPLWPGPGEWRMAERDDDGVSDT